MLSYRFNFTLCFELVHLEVEVEKQHFTTFITLHVDNVSTFTLCCSPLFIFKVFTFKEVVVELNRRVVNFLVKVVTNRIVVDALISLKRC